MRSVFTTQSSVKLRSCAMCSLVRSSWIPMGGICPYLGCRRLTSIFDPCVCVFPQLVVGTPVSWLDSFQNTTRSSWKPKASGTTGWQIGFRSISDMTMNTEAFATSCADTPTVPNSIHSSKYSSPTNTSNL